MEPLKIFPAYEQAWDHFLRRGWYLLGLTVAVLVIGGLVIGNALASALYGIIIGGYISLLLRHARHEGYVFDDVFIIDQRWVYLAFLVVIKALLIALGLLFFIVPGVYLMLRWMFSELYVLDKGMRPIESLQASSELTLGYKWKLFFFFLTNVLFAFLGMLALGVGIFVAIPVITLAYIMVFWKLQELKWKAAQG